MARPHLPILTLATMLFASWASTAAESGSPPPPPAAPLPGSAAIYVSAEQLADELKASIAKAADPALSTVAVTNQYFIHEVHRGKPGSAAVHVGWTELHFILDGAATLVTGGRMTAGANPTIEGGVSHMVKKGDAVIVPAETPHQYQQVGGSLVYLEVRFINPAAH